MASNAWFKPTCKVSRSTIAKHLSISTRQVGNSQAKLKAAGLISVIASGLRQVTTYQLNSLVFTPKAKPNLRN